MSKKRNFNKYKYLLLALVVLVLTVISGLDFQPAFAETTTYSSVIEHLRKDSNFNFGDYAENPKDYSIQVIQIAESTDGELFIYTYQPCQSTLPLVATEINMSLSESADGTTLYGLTQLNTWGVFGKYKVNGFKVSTENKRIYNISTIYRNYDKLADGGELSGYNSIAFKVGQCWTVTTTGGKVNYAMEKVDTITITDCAYGSIRVPSGFNFFISYSCDMHIIAFDTDIKIDNLLEADVSFKYRFIEESLYDDYPDNWQPKQVTINYKEKGSSSDHIFGDGVRTWDRIQTSTEFLNTCARSKIELSDDVKQSIRRNKWVLAFWETEYSNATGGVFGFIYWLGAVVGAPYKNYTQVTDATILRLEYIKDGITYNLGAVSNKTGDFTVIAGEDKTFFDYVWDFIKDKLGGLSWWQWLLIGLAVILGIGLIFTVIKFGIGAVFSFLWWLVCLPFRAIKSFIDKIGGD